MSHAPHIAIRSIQFTLLTGSLIRLEAGLSNNVHKPALMWGYEEAAPAADWPLKSKSP